MGPASQTHFHLQHVTFKGTLGVTTQEDLWTLPGNEAAVFAHIPLARTQSFGHLEVQWWLQIVIQLSTQEERRNGSATAGQSISTAENRIFKIIFLCLKNYVKIRGQEKYNYRLI